jgi:hypothetical protein
MEDTFENSNEIYKQYVIESIKKLQTGLKLEPTELFFSASALIEFPNSISLEELNIVRFYLNLFSNLIEYAKVCKKNINRVYILDCIKSIKENKDFTHLCHDSIISTFCHMYYLSKTISSVKSLRTIELQNPSTYHHLRSSKKKVFIIHVADKSAIKLIPKRCSKYEYIRVYNINSPSIMREIITNIQYQKTDIKIYIFVQYNHPINRTNFSIIQNFIKMNNNNSKVKKDNITILFETMNNVLENNKNFKKIVNGYFYSYKNTNLRRLELSNDKYGREGMYDVNKIVTIDLGESKKEYIVYQCFFYGYGLDQLFGKPKS